MPSFFFHVVIETNSFLKIGQKDDLFGVSRNPLSLPGIQEPASATTTIEAPKNIIDLTTLSSRTKRQSGKPDWRAGSIAIRKIDMQRASSNNRRDKLNTAEGQGQNDRITIGAAGSATQGRFEPLDLGEEDLGWGIIRLYRDSDETSGLYRDVLSSRPVRHGSSDALAKEKLRFSDEDCKTLCILAVPSYLTPSDFLGFVGEATREDVSHFRMIRTGKINRYMVLMKFRHGKRARAWRKEWDGKPFNEMEGQHCHVVFVKSVEFRALVTPGDDVSFPDMTNDPFTPLVMAKVPSAISTKPMAPPTPSLIELPTCPVCLERMDESTGLLTILCQHVFHCSCLERWKGAGCPVCRYTQEGLGRRIQGEDPSTELNECSICRSDANLWICLICGNVGCGRYDAAHAFLHYQHSSHCFAMELATQRVWDYGSDGYVHRIFQSKLDGKLVAPPAASDANLEDYVPREKVDAIGREYTHLLSSQLDSQRLYFEQKLERAADKASQAIGTAARASDASTAALAQLTTLQLAHETLVAERLPGLEKERDRAMRKADKFETMARKLEKEWREEKALNGGCLEKIQWLEERATRLADTEAEGRVTIAELEDVNRDLSFFISSKEKLDGLGEEVVQGTVSLPERRKKKSKGKSRKTDTTISEAGDAA